MRLRTVLATTTAALAAATCLSAASPATAQEDHACSPAVSIDRFSDALDKTTYDGTFVGNFSALAVDRDGSLAALSDRSSLFALDAKTLEPQDVVPLADEKGAALDSEGLVIDRDGTRLITSETEPSVRRYSPQGKILDRLPVPPSLQVAPAGRAVSNGTFEGLTMLPGGRTLLASMEYALSGDSPGIVRFQTWERHRKGFALGAQYAYRTDTGLGVPEVQATPDGRLLVLERGFTSGVGNTVRLYLADPRRATDTSGIENLTGQDGVRLIKKTLLADIADCPTLGATAKQPQPNPLLDNIEGMAITGTSKGALRVLLVSDDNQNAVQTTRFYYLRVRI
ncbi:esterase-like activity of phytase family protein [Streptomyces sp. NL15-2K]|uniref:esterase-like activity of phytase family protein n=1 Tax=Streptomyces sp. NL15-2K TaxID=376149 RepID=UPI000F574B98|nr:MULTISPECIES: esterase-like activity of phytase family protein [Actinomycetes]WKX09329.1 esterase-like activity of phytase family protein [Kutzneria buriramensis]GCB49174.1 lipoprotein [Streptomyces sp. NL15-2K]